MAVLYTPHFIQFGDNNLNPLAGGKLYTYAAGTNTPKATYTDTTESTQLSNPIILDSAGRATLFLKGSYKFRLEDSLGNLIKETDSITAFNTSATTLNDLLPSQSGNAGKQLTTDGSNASWVATSSSVSIFKDTVLNGLNISINAIDSVNDIDIAAGSCVSDDGTTAMTLSTSYTKQLDVAWAVGTNSGGRDTGSISDAVWYVWIINRTDTGVTDVLLSTSSSSPTMPSGYTKKKKIGSFTRASGSIVSYSFANTGISTSNPIRTKVIINQTGTQSITSGTNISSITDLGTGLTRITFSQPYPNTNYNVQASAVQKNGSYYLHAGVYYTGGSLSKTTTYVDVQAFYASSAAFDSEYLDVIIIGELA